MLDRLLNTTITVGELAVAETTPARAGYHPTATHHLVNESGAHR